MATKKYTIQQKQNDGSMLTIHPETEASAVSADAKFIISDGKPGLAHTVANELASAYNLVQGNFSDISNILASKGKANGFASLGSDGKVPSSQLPSYVDDVLEYSSYSNLTSNGSKETGKIYVTTDNGKIYRWSGSTYVEISSPVKFGTTAGTAYEGSAGKECRDIVDRLLSGAQPIGSAYALANARTISISTNGNISGGSANFDGSENVDISINLTETMPSGGTYSCVTVDKYGRVTDCAQIVQVGGTSADGLAAGGIWFKEI